MERFLSLIVAVLFCLGAWEMISYVTLLPGVWPVVLEFRNYCLSNSFAVDMLYSWSRILMSFVLSVSIGLVFGLISGYGGFVGDVVLRTGDLFRPVPAISFLPVVSLIFTNINLCILVVILIGGVFPIFVSVSTGLRNVSSVRLIRVGESFCAVKRQLFWKIKVPLALKALSIGVQTSSGTIWTVLVTAEMLSGKGGLGYKTWESYTLLNYPGVMVGMILIGISGYVLNVVVGMLFRKLFGGFYVE